MRILVDADACPVKAVITHLAKRHSIAVVMVLDSSHVFSDGYSEVVTVDTGRDSADLYLANLMRAGDIVVTQDYGVAAMALGKGARALNQDGLVYDADNMDRLLFERHLGQKVRRASGRTRGVKKRTAEMDAQFELVLERMLLSEQEGTGARNG